MTIPEPAGKDPAGGVVHWPDAGRHLQPVRESFRPETGELHADGWSRPIQFIRCPARRWRQGQLDPAACSYAREVGGTFRAALNTMAITRRSFVKRHHLAGAVFTRRSPKVDDRRGTSSGSGDPARPGQARRYRASQASRSRRLPQSPAEFRANRRRPILPR